MSQHSRRSSRRARAIAIKREDTRPALMMLGLLGATTLMLLVQLLA